MFFLISCFFGHFESLAFFRKWGLQTLHQSGQVGYLSEFFKSTTKVTIYSKKLGYFD